jgi:uncharacterized protein YjdB
MIKPLFSSKNYKKQQVDSFQKDFGIYSILRILLRKDTYRQWRQELLCIPAHLLKRQFKMTGKGFVIRLAVFLTAFTMIACSGDDPIAAPITVSGVTLDAEAVSVEEGRTITLLAAILPGNAANNVVMWESSNPAVATVVNGVVTGVSAAAGEGASTGKATITVRTADGGHTARCAVTVLPAFAGDTRPTGILLSSASLELGWGEWAWLSVMATPSGADNTVNWSTSNPLVATVDEYGWVTGTGKGSATITARAVYAEGNVTASCVVTVATTPITISGTVSVTIKGTQLPASDFDLDIFTDASLDYRFYIDTADVTDGVGGGACTWSITLPVFDADTTLYFGIDILNSMLGIIKTGQAVTVKDQNAANIAITVTINAVTLSGKATATINSSPVSADDICVHAYAGGEEIGSAWVNSFDNSWEMDIFALSAPTTVSFKLEAGGIVFDTGVTRSVHTANVSGIILNVTGTTKTITGTLNGGGIVFALSSPVAGFLDPTIVSKIAGEAYPDWEGNWTMMLSGTAPVNLWFLAGIYDEEAEKYDIYITSAAVNTSSGVVILHTSTMTYLESLGAEEEEE